MENSILIVMVNPAGDYWEIVGTPTTYNSSTVIPTYFESYLEAEKIAKDRAVKMGCETRIIRIETISIFEPQAIQVEIKRVQRELLNPHQDYATKEWRGDDSGQPTLRIGGSNG